MKHIYKCGPDEFLKNAKLPTRVLNSEQDMYEEIANIMVDTIIKNGERRTVFICPVGPIAQYPIFVKMVNKEKISLKNVWFFNMDEYLDDDDAFISTGNLLSFRTTMEKLVYSKINSELIMPAEQRVFPIPGRGKECDKLLDDLGGADCCLTGVGINGHIAFNEPPSVNDDITDEEFAKTDSRCLNIATETIVNNGSRKIGGALDIFPKRCVTLGMRQILNSKNLKIYLYCDWQWGIMRKLSLEPPSRFTPASFLQLHPNSEMVITNQLLHYMI
ncbi:MAG: glucosamine-6-phosphate isomerase [Oscillospiraceae bacterium]|nr:glucosamine-6-phosphate isomerase [Oscillospiraceae bacterium]